MTPGSLASLATLAARLALPALLACGGGFGGPTAAPPPPAPEGAVTMQVGPGGTPGVNLDTMCSATPVPLSIVLGGVSIGELVGAVPTDGGVAVTCSVRPNTGHDAGAFDVSATISFSGGASFSVVGEMGPSEGTAATTLESDGVVYTSHDPCTIDLGGYGGIRAGAVYGTLTCPQVFDAQGHACLASADFVFENCGE